MEKFIRLICKYNKKAKTPVRQDEIKLAILMNKHLVIRRYEKRMNRPKR